MSRCTSNLGYVHPAVGGGRWGVTGSQSHTATSQGLTGHLPKSLCTIWLQVSEQTGAALYTIWSTGGAAALGLLRVGPTWLVHHCLISLHYSSCQHRNAENRLIIKGINIQYEVQSVTHFITDNPAWILVTNNALANLAQPDGPTAHLPTLAQECDSAQRTAGRRGSSQSAEVVRPCVPLPKAGLF